MSWISELLRQKKISSTATKITFNWTPSQNFSKIVPMSLDSEICSVFIQSQESKTQLKLFEYIRKIFTNIRIYS